MMKFGSPISRKKLSIRQNQRYFFEIIFSLHFFVEVLFWFFICFFHLVCFHLFNVFICFQIKKANEMFNIMAQRYVFKVFTSYFTRLCCRCTKFMFCCIFICVVSQWLAELSQRLGTLEKAVFNLNERDVKAV